MKKSGLDKRIILKLILTEKGWKELEWIYLAHHKINWRVVVNTAVNLTLHYKGVFHVSQRGH
jgi:hypothetical protein